MALPNLSTTQNAIIVRYNVDTGEWFYVDKADTVVFDDPGPGVWLYEIWLVLGSSPPSGATNGEYSGRIDLGLLEAKR